MLKWYKKQSAMIRAAIITGAFVIIATIIAGIFELFKPNQPIIIYPPTEATTASTISSASTTTPQIEPTPIYTVTPSSTPTDRDMIMLSIRTYYDNIPNYGVTDDNIRPDDAWGILTPSLQGVFKDKESWWDSTSPYRYIVNLDETSQSIFIEWPDAKADIFREMRSRTTGTTYSKNEKITICFRHEDGQWLINHINNSTITLKACKSF